MGRFVGTVIAAGAALALSAALAGTAIACPPPPPYPPAPRLAEGTPPANVTAWEQAWEQAWSQTSAVRQRDWSLQQQVRLFDEAKALVVVRYDREGKTSGYPKEDDFRNGQRLSVLSPVRWVKGAGKGTELKLEFQDAEMCMRMPAHEAFYGKPGDVFLIYLKGDTLEQANVLEGVPVSEVVEPRALAALTAD